MDIDYSAYKQKSDENNERIRDQMKEALDLGVATVGGKQALHAALLTQHELCAEFFSVISGIYHRSIERGMEPVLPLTQEVIESFNNAAGSLQMVAELMKRGILDDLRDN